MNLTMVTVPIRYFGVNFYDAAIVPYALGKVKSLVQEEGFTCTTLDLATDYFRKTYINQPIFFKINPWLVDNSTNPVDAPNLDINTERFWTDMLHGWADRIIETNPEWVAISLFINDSCKAGFDLCKILKERAPSIKIVITGAAVEEYFDYTKKIHVGDYFMDNKVIDAFITGECDRSIIELLKGNEYSGINNYEPIQVTDFDQQPPADYSDLNMDHYVYPDPWDLNNPQKPVMVITLSRGCCYKCNYCDLNYYFKDFIIGDPNNLVQETIHYYETYGVTEFNFSDTLINIDIKKFKQYLEGIIKYQEQNNIKFRLYGMSVIRPQAIFGEEMFELQKKAGFFDIAYGVESYSPRVRSEMNKGKFSNSDVDFTIDQCFKHDIMPFCMLIIGYPTETLEDWKETKKLIRRYAPNTGDKYIDDLREEMFGLSILRFRYASNLFERQEKLGVEIDDKLQYWKGTECDINEAQQRIDETVTMMKELGYLVDEKNYAGGNGLSNGLHGLVG